jgi:hypothetical protein
MARKGVPGIISCGNRHEWPRSMWGWKDWQDEDRLQAKLGMGVELGNSVVVPPPGPQSAMTTPFPPKPRRRREAGGAQSRAVDKLLDELGIGRR